LLTAVAAGVFGYRVLSVAGGAWMLAQCAGLIYTPGFLRSFGFGSYNGALWTIPIELQFYVMYPILAWFVSKSGRPVAGLVAAFVVFMGAGVLARIYAPSIMLVWGQADESFVEKFLRYNFIPYFFLFITGALAYRLRLWDSRLLRGKALIWAGAVFIFWAYAPVTPWSQIIWFLLLGGFAISAAYTFTGLKDLLRGQDISYGVYIYHGLILNIMIEFDYKLRLVYVIGVIAISYTAGFLSWRTIEKPCLRLKRSPTSAGSDSRRPEDDLDGSRMVESVG
jgi:peptidoglycan/LPS O-acetylase OafA/YrhL